MRKRSKYRPRPVMRDPVGYVITGFKPMTKDQIERSSLRQHGSMYALTHGEGSQDDWEVITELLNVSIALSQTVFGDAYKEEIRAAMLAHAKCGQRKVKAGTWGYTGEELTAVNTAMEIYAEMMKQATMGEIGDALKVVEHAHRQGNFYASVRIGI